MSTEPLIVDSLGKPCPIPIIELADAVDRVGVGEAVMLLADDPAARTDVSVWCRMKRHELVAVEEHQPGLRFTIRKT